MVEMVATAVVGLGGSSNAGADGWVRVGEV